MLTFSHISFFTHKNYDLIATDRFYPSIAIVRNLSDGMSIYIIHNINNILGTFDYTDTTFSQTLPFSQITKRDLF